MPPLDALSSVHAPNETGRPSPFQRYVVRLGQHHFAHLRAVAEGIPVVDSARRYLGIEHGHKARTAHQQVIDAVRSIARRRSERAWRLIGLTIHAPTSAARPSLEDFIVNNGLDGWSEAEVQAMYLEAIPVDSKAMRRERLRERQLDLLQRLQTVATVQAHPTDPIDGWFDKLLSQRLQSAGFMTLQDLVSCISRGGRWENTLKGIGRIKALRIKSFLQILLGVEAIKRPTTHFPPEAIQTPCQPQEIASGAVLSGHFFSNAARHPPFAEAGRDTVVEFSSTDTWTEDVCLLDAGSDTEAIASWINARAGSTSTAKSYRREGTRLLLWLQHERGERRFSAMTVEDCRAYMAFLQNIPDRWISRSRAAPGEIGWAPFKGQLRHQSYRQAITIVASLFAWLHSVRYLIGNPWVLVNHKSGDNKLERKLETKSLSDGALHQVLRYFSTRPPSTSRDRIDFIVRFVEAVGLRSSELLGASLGDFILEPEGCVLQVHGKGAKNRIVAIPAPAYAALQRYLQQRGLDSLEFAPKDAPLIASLSDTMAPVGYQALYEHVRGWLRRAIKHCDICDRDRSALQMASIHWLRHTFGTRSIARNVPLDVIQAQMGHANIQTTTANYGRAPMGRRGQELGRAFGGQASEL